MQHFSCDHLFTGQEWLESAVLSVDEQGVLQQVRTATDPAADDVASQPTATDSQTVHLGKIVIPGIANLHSHAHQRAMAGLAERSGHSGQDSFWTWRTLMYRHLESMTPDDLEAIAAQLYVEMLEAGYTAVGEFQYLHHQTDGVYDEPAEMTLRCLAAARRVGIGFTALPVLYMRGGFGAAPATDGQRRFVSSAAQFQRMYESLQRQIAPGAESVGVAPHSLRAVGQEDLEHLLSWLDPSVPVHLHIAEQVQEVDDCVACHGARPVQWLFDHFAIDHRWCLIHATHLDDAEVGLIADSGAVVGLCPVTEANLGDGVFRAQEYLSAGGSIGIGSDSHISVSPVEELRWLEYGQRLHSRSRNVLAGGADQSTGRHLFSQAISGGAQACRRDIDGLRPGQRADWLVLAADSPLLVCRHGDELLDSWIFSGNRSCIHEVWVGGRRVVEGGKHPEREAVAQRFHQTLKTLRTTA